MEKKLRIYMVINNQIFSCGIENLIQKSSTNSEVIQQKCLQDLMIDDCTCSNILIYDVQKISNQDFNELIRLNTSYKNLKVLLITSTIKVSEVKLLFEIGVFGVITNTVSPELFSKYFNKLISGEKVLSPEYSKLIIEYFCYSTSKITIGDKKLNKEFVMFEELTKREKQILGHICEGKSTREISEQLFISLHTVETHRRKILSKLGVKNTASMVIAAIKNKLYLV